MLSLPCLLVWSALMVAPALSFHDEEEDRLSPRIVGGVEADIGDFEFFVQGEGKSVSVADFLCGAVASIDFCLTIAPLSLQDVVPV